MSAVEEYRKYMADRKSMLRSNAESLADAAIAELEADAWEQTECARKALTELAALKDGISRRIEQEVAADTAELLAELAGLEFQRDALLEELDDLKARHCGTCLFSEICLAHVDSTEGLFPVESCSRWTPQP